MAARPATTALRALQPRCRARAALTSRPTIRSSCRAPANAPSVTRGRFARSARVRPPTALQALSMPRLSRRAAPPARLASTRTRLARATARLAQVPHGAIEDPATPLLAAHMLHSAASCQPTRLIPLRRVGSRQLLRSWRRRGAALPGWHILEYARPHGRERMHRLPEGISVLYRLDGTCAMCSGHDRASSQGGDVHRLYCRHLPRHGRSD